MISFFENGIPVLADERHPGDFLEPLESRRQFRHEIKVSALRVLLAIEPLTKAAEDLGISPQRLSKHVQNFSEKLGISTPRAAHRDTDRQRALDCWQKRGAA